MGDKFFDAETLRRRENLKVMKRGFFSASQRLCVERTFSPFQAGC